MTFWATSGRVRRTVTTGTTTIAKAGRLVVPKAVREACGLRPGTHVRFLVRDGRIEIEPVPLDVSLERHGSTVVAVPREGRPVLTAAEVGETTTSLRERSSSRRVTRYLCDTSALVATVCSWHEHHARTLAEIERRERAGEELVLAAHSLAEAYAVVTRLPAPNRLRSRDAIALLEANWRETPVVHLTASET